MPKGLNAPDPYLPPSKARCAGSDAQLAPPPSAEDDDRLVSISLAPFAHAPKLGLKKELEFTLPDDIVEALDQGRVLASASFQPPAYAQIRRSVYVHEYERERLDADDVMVCSCSASRGGCEENCQNAAMQHECNPST